MGRWLIVAALLGLLGASAYVLYVGWTMGGDQVDISGQGYLAMILGIVFSLVVGCGLMALLFYSHRRGYDDEAAPRFGDDNRRDDKP